jgi:DDE superfamily endonuclease
VAGLPQCYPTSPSRPRRRESGSNIARRCNLLQLVPSRAQPRSLSCARHESSLLHLLVQTLGAVGSALTFVIDETLERRWSRCISQRAHYRNPVASSKHRSIATSGLRWIVLTLVITPPWTRRSWALPVLSVLAPTPEVSRPLGLQHKTVPQRACQIMLLVHRWLPAAELTIIGDQTYSVLELGSACARHDVRLIAPLRLDAALYAPVPPRVPGTNGRPRVKGERLPQLKQVLKEPQTIRQRVCVQWSDGRRCTLDMTRGTAVWYRIGQPVLPVRCIIVRDPAGKLEPRPYFSTCPSDRARDIVIAFIKRWTIETTFEESRAHLGLETQWQWSDRAIERTTPCLFGLYSVVALLAHALYSDGKIPIHTTAWYHKSQATFADVLAAVRRHLWGDFSYSTSAHDPDVIEIPRSELNRLAYAVFYSH